MLGLGFWVWSQEEREIGFGFAKGKKEEKVVGLVCGGRWWRGCTAAFVVAVASWLAESLALSSASASQNALWVTKLSFLWQCISEENLKHHFN